MTALFVIMVAAWLACLWFISPALWTGLNAIGENIGRAVAWFCSGGLGWSLARVQIEQARRADAMARLMIDAAGWRREARARSTGLAQYVDSPQRGGLPGEIWCKRCGTWHSRGFWYGP